MAKKMTPFQAAFAKARKEKGAEGMFTFNGKKYNTRRADDKPKTSSKPKAKPAKKKDSKPVDTITPKGLRGAKDRVGSGLSMSSKDFRKAPSQPDDFGTMKKSSAATKKRAGSKIDGGLSMSSKDFRKAPSRPDDFGDFSTATKRQPKMSDEMKGLSLAKGGVAKKPVKKNMGGMMKYNKGGTAKKPMKMMGGGMMKYKSGGKVRGCGIAKQGNRPVKMVTMKGS